MNTRTLLTTAVAALICGPAFAHHPAADNVDPDTYARIEERVADTPHADMTFDDMGRDVDAMADRARDRTESADGIADAARQRAQQAEDRADAARQRSVTATQRSDDAQARSEAAAGRNEAAQARTETATGRRALAAERAERLEDAEWSMRLIEVPDAVSFE